MADYFVEGGDVLENKFGISDSEELRKTEEFYFSEAASDIITNIDESVVFNFNFLLDLHRRLFGRVYYFAGKIRTVNITKTDSDIPFCYADFIGVEAERIFDNLKSKDYLRGFEKDEFAIELAKLSSELNALHPFREGNGRTIRLFLQLLTNSAGFMLDYSLVEHEEIVNADKAAFLGDMGPISELYKKVVRKI